MWIFRQPRRSIDENTADTKAALTKTMCRSTAIAKIPTNPITVITRTHIPTMALFALARLRGPLASAGRAGWDRQAVRWITAKELGIDVPKTRQELVAEVAATRRTGSVPFTLEVGARGVRCR